MSNIAIDKAITRSQPRQWQLDSQAFPLVIELLASVDWIQERNS